MGLLAPRVLASAPESRLGYVGFVVARLKKLNAHHGTFQRRRCPIIKREKKQYHATGTSTTFYVMTYVGRKGENAVLHSLQQHALSLGPLTVV